MLSTAYARTSCAVASPSCFRPFVLACGGGGGGTDRRTLVDSRDNYDPRSLDPALSTDVPTGRAVGYLFDGLTRFTPDARVVPGARHELGRLPRRPHLHLSPASRRHLHRRHALRRPPGAASSWQRVLDPKVRGGRGWPLYPDQRRGGVRRRQGHVDRRPRRARTTPRSSSRSRSRSRSSPSCSPCRSPRSCRTTCPPTSASIRSAPDRGSSSSGSTTTTCSSRATRTTGAARRRPTRSRRASSPSRAPPSPSSRAATSTCSRSRRARSATGRRTTSARSSSRRRRRSSWCTSPSTPRAARSPTRACDRRSTTPSTGASSIAT